MPQSVTEPVADSGTGPSSRRRDWRIARGGALAGLLTLIVGMLAVMVVSELLAGKRGAELTDSLALATPVVVVVTVLLATLLHVALRRVRRRALYVAGVGLGAAVVWILLITVLLPAMVSGQADPAAIAIGAALGVVWTVAPWAATSPTRLGVAGSAGPMRP